MPLPKEKQTLVLNNKEIMSKWDYEKNKKNNIDPSKFTQGSHQKAYFKCPKCGNEWYGVIRDSARYNGCKICMKKARSISNVKTKLRTRESLFITNPELESEWDYIENEKNGLDPNLVMARTNKKAYWICPNGHRYHALISNRTSKNSGCSICAGQSILEGYNDLATTRPDLLEEWNYEANSKIGLHPQKVMRGSHQKVYWICPFGHNYKKSIKERDAGRGCTECAKESQTSFPEQALYFYISKVFPDTINRYGNPEIDIFIPTLKFGIEYDGFFAHKNKQEFETKKDNIIKSNGISLIRVKEIDELKEDTKNVIYCNTNSNNTYMNNVLEKIEKIINTNYDLNIKLNPNIERDRIKIEEQYISSRKENSIVNKRPDIAKEWDYAKNGSLKPEYISCGNSRKYFWICQKGHSYQASPKHRCHGTNCPYCALKKFKTGINDIKTLYPDVINDWDYNLNQKKPEEEIAVLSHKFYWICPKKHSYCATLKVKIKKSQCTVCSGKEILMGYNDLKSVYPELARNWDYNKNDKTPEKYNYSSNKSVFWICHNCGYKWKAVISNRPNCPNCSKYK